jgi:hypothetical protein
MKGTSCGQRALALVVPLALALAVAPAALADPLGAVSSASGTAPAPVPALPVVKSPVSVQLATPAGPVTASASVSAPAAAVSTPVASAHVSRSGATVKAGTLVVQTVHRTAHVVTTTARKVIASTPVTHRVAGKVQSTHARLAKKHVSVVVKAHAKLRPIRILAWTSDDPMSGCEPQGSWLVCTTTNGDFSTTNQCNGEPVTLIGTYTFWTKFFMNMNGTVIMRQRTFFVGFTGTGGFGNSYKGTDQQNDSQKSFPIGSFSEDQREYEALQVTQQADPLAPAQNMHMYLHLIVFFNAATATANVHVVGPFVVCNKGQKAQGDDDQGTDNNPTDQQHNEQAYYGYNDDDNTWNGN